MKRWCSVVIRHDDIRECAACGAALVNTLASVARDKHLGIDIEAWEIAFNPGRLVYYFCPTLSEAAMTRLGGYEVHSMDARPHLEGARRILLA